MGKRDAEAGRDLPLVKLLPNLLTLTAVCAGLTAIRFGFQGEYEWAVRLILIAGLLDGLDGRLARLLRSQSLVGAELDSLGDFLNFGVAPALVLYLWTLHQIDGLGWIASLCFALCCLLRLARFNVDTKKPGAAAQGAYFVGVPSPAGAALALLPLVISFFLSVPQPFPAAATAAYTVLVGLLMISRLPTYSFKNLTVSRRRARFVLLGIVLLAAALLIYTWATLILLMLAYIVGIGLAFRAHTRSRHREGKLGN